MRRVFRILFILAAALAGVVSSVVYFQFLRYQGAVDRIIATLPPEERNIPTPAVHVFERLDGRMVPWLATRGLLREVGPWPESQGSWHLRHALWGVLLPLRIPRRDMISLYAHYMTFEGGDGLSYGAHHYYAKNPTGLNIEEAVSLVTISRGPDRFSPERRRGQYDLMYRKLLAQYHAAG